ncbi:AAA family ATPase [Maribacter sp. 2307ULW6-5]|uniref:AAA family ATPase n=1 Tax=Maribacter sp. 2307ULW6-5 TaxID=3386275 RepID=UPI0039BCEC47
MKKAVPHRIVITGGPGTGKTALVQFLENAGYHCFHEVVREMTLAAKKTVNRETALTNPLTFVKDPREFNQILLEAREADFHAAKNLEHPVVFYDRGIPDVLAYMDYFGQPYGIDFEGPAQQHRYDVVFLLPPWEAIYVQDNERMESYAEARAIHAALEAVYARLGYATIEVPLASVGERAAFIEQKVLEHGPQQGI